MKKTLFFAILIMVILISVPRKLYCPDKKNNRTDSPNTLGPILRRYQPRCGWRPLRRDGGEQQLRFSGSYDGVDIWPTERLRDGIFVINNHSAENSADPKFLSINTSVSDTVGIINQSFHGMYFKKGMGNMSLTIRFRKISAETTFNEDHLLDQENNKLAAEISLGRPEP